MSNEVLGYVEFRSEHDRQAFSLEAAGIGLPIGLFELGDFELISFFPDEYAPGNNKVCAFCISDDPDTPNASYLIDGLDYAEEACIGLPLLARDRIELLAGVLRTICEADGVTRVVVALTQCCQIDVYAEISAKDIFKTFLEDFDEYAPPDTIYVISPDQD